MIRHFTLSSTLLPHVLAFLLVLLLLNNTHAQAPVNPVMCGNDIFNSMVKSHHPDLYAAFENTFEEAHQAQHGRGSDPLIIPVVIHIVWNDPSENLHDSIILNQLEILNNDFNKLNADTIELRDVYKPVAASANIHFDLVQIVRIHTNELFSVDLLGGTLLPEVKQTDLGGSDGWEPLNYLNIWVCKIQPIEIFGVEVGQILGFSFPPNNLAHWPENVGAPTPGEDGVVVDYRVVGSNNPNTIDNPVDLTPLDVKGRTPVHEVGHYLGLRHIWGDGGTFGPNDCAQSDGIDDTPFANAQSNFDCDKSKNSCDIVEDYYDLDMPDLIENYMDYASEACMNMFTQGQVDLMRNVLLGPRAALVTEPAAVGDVAINNEINVSPNPTKDVVEVKFNAGAKTISKVVLLSFDGKMINDNLLIHQSSQDVVRIQLGDLQSGLYLMQLWDGERSYVRKVVVQ